MPRVISWISDQGAYITTAATLLLFTAYWVQQAEVIDDTNTFILDRVMCLV